MVDLCVYAHRLFHLPADQLEAYVKELLARDFRVLNLAGSEFESIRALPKLAQVAKIRTRFDTHPHGGSPRPCELSRNRGCRRQTSNHSSTLQATAHSGLVAALGNGIATGLVRSLDLEVASKIATGAHGLVTTFVQTLSDSLVRTKRLTSCQWTDQEALVDAIHTLGPEVPAMLSRFRVNKQGFAQVELQQFQHAPESCNDSGRGGQGQGC